MAAPATSIAIRDTGARKMASAYPPSSTSASRTQPAIIGTPIEPQDGPGPEIMAASTLDGNNVVNLADEDLARSRRS
jgi:hypothetical protein